MAFYYVKGGGAATGDQGRADVKRTGTWNATATEYYDTLTAALAATTAPTAGDIICWSATSTDTVTGNTEVPIPEGVSIISVDNANQDQYLPAISAQIDNASTNNYSILTDGNLVNGFAFLDGVNVKSGVGTTLLTWNEVGGCVWHDVTYTSTATTPAWNATYAFQSEGGGIRSINSTFNHDTSDYLVTLIIQDNEAVFLGGEIDVTGRVQQSQVANGRGKYYGVNLSNGSTQLMEAPIATASGYAHFWCCNLPVGWITTTDMSASSSSCIVVEECDNSYQFLMETHPGVIEFVTDVYYNSHDTLDDGISKGSYEYETNSDTARYLPLSISHFYHVHWLSAINDEAATKKKVRLRFATANGQTLDTADVNVYVLYPGTDQHECVYHRVSLLESGSALSTETGNWTGAGLGTQYYLDVDMGSPLNGRVMLYPEVTKANVTVYFSWQLEFVA